MRALHSALIAILCLALLTPFATAQVVPAPTKPEQPTLDLPDSILGQRMRAILDAFSPTGTTRLNPDWFSPEFLESVPPIQLGLIPMQMRTETGGLNALSVSPNPDTKGLIAVIQAVNDNTHLRLYLDLDDNDLITGLLLRPAVDLDYANDTWDTITNDLSAIAQDTGLAVLRLEEYKAPRPLAEHNPDKPLAVGSAFKLYVLGALIETIRDGETSWQDPLPIQSNYKSLPSGVMQMLNEGVEKPIAEFALKMISISDNTATDHLIALVGRENIEAFQTKHSSNTGNTFPFLMTREMFAIKLGDDPKLAQQYADASDDERRAMINEGGEYHGKTANLVNAASWKSPRFIDTIEWFATPKDACRAIAAIRDLASEPGQEPAKTAMTTNPGVPVSDNWDTVWFKGGSEPGVINLTFLVEHNSGARYALSLTANDPSRLIPEDTAILLATRVIGLLDRLSTPKQD